MIDPTEAKQNTQRAKIGSLPKGAVVTKMKDGTDMYSYRGKDYNSREELLQKVPHWNWVTNTAEFIGKTLMSSPTVRTVLPKISKASESLTVPFEDEFATQVGLSAEQYGIDRRVGELFGYAIYPGAGEIKAIPRVFKGKQIPALVGVEGYDAYRTLAKQDLPVTRYEASSGLGTGSKGRTAKSDVLSPPGSKKGGGYKTEGEYWDGRKSITNVHHGGGLEDQGRAVAAHKSFDDLDVSKGQRSPIVTYAERNYGIKGGNAKDNLIDILEVNTHGSRSARVQAIHKQYGGKVDPRTINDMLRGSKGQLNIKDLPPHKVVELEAYRAKGIKVPTSFYDDLPKDLFPTINIRNKKGDIIESWRPTTIEEYQNRFNIVGDKLGVKNKVDLKKIKIDPKLEIFSSDHHDVHKLIKDFQKTPGNPLHTIETAIADGTYRNMPVGQAAKLYADAHKFQEQIAASVLRRRYAKIEKLFKKKYPNGYKGLGETFEELGKPAQQQFFKENVNEIARIDIMGKGATPADVFQDPRQGWTKGMTNVYGWNPTADIKPTTIKNPIKQAKKL